MALFRLNKHNEPKKEKYFRIVEQNKGIIYKVARSYCITQDDREDLIQEIIVQLWRSIDTYNSAYKASTWMYRIALNVAISSFRKDKKVKHEHVDINDVYLRCEQDVEQHEEKDVQQLYVFINQLSNVDKAIILLYLEGESYTSIAENLDVSVTNVATKLGRIKQKLKQKFDKQRDI